jgi:hypothetical protein
VAEHHFTLRFDVKAVGGDAEQYAERLGAGGCDDAIVGIGKPGCLALTFDREAAHAREAVLSAMRDATGALPGVVLLEASPDLVGLSDLADIVGRTRQNMRKLLLTCGGSAPAPAHEGSSSMWHLAPVLAWLRSEKSYSVPDDLVDLARTTMQLNLAVDRNLIDDAVQKEIAALIR